MLKPVIAGMIALALISLSGPVAAQDLQTSFAGIRWGAPAGEGRGLTLVRRSGDETYFAKDEDFYSLGGVNCERVRYGFYRDQFFAAFMQIPDQKDFQAVREHLDQRYGAARSQMRIDRTIYIWDFLDVKIKLKHYEDHPEAKLAFYYTPLSTQVNAARKAGKSETVIKLDTAPEEQEFDF
jgi:hypothetical protein